MEKPTPNEVLISEIRPNELQILSDTPAEHQRRNEYHGSNEILPLHTPVLALVQEPDPRLYKPVEEDRGMVINHLP